MTLLAFAGLPLVTLLHAKAGNRGQFQSDRYNHHWTTGQQKRVLVLVTNHHSRFRQIKRGRGGQSCKAAEQLRNKVTVEPRVPSCISTGTMHARPFSVRRKGLVRPTPWILIAHLQLDAGEAVVLHRLARHAVNDLQADLGPTPRQQRVA